MRLPGLIRARLDQWIELYQINRHEITSNNLSNSNGDWYQSGYADGIYDQLTELGYADYINARIVPDRDSVAQETRQIQETHRTYQEGYAIARIEVKNSLPGIS